MGRAVDCGDIGGVQGGADHTVCAGIDDGSGPAGLSDDAGAFQLRHF